MERTRTAVIPISGPSGDLERFLKRLVRAESAGPGGDVVVVSDRPVRLPPALGRRVRVVRVRTAEAVVTTVEEMRIAGAEVLGPTTKASRRASISACLIVKDEETVIEQCLRAVIPFADEVVVYDTGSSDRTVAIARASGVTVVEGYWDDHFANARNRAMDHCASEWVLTVDADETCTGDPTAVRRQLEGETCDLVFAYVVSTTWSGSSDGTEILSPRLARREKVLWQGRLHEHLVPRAGGKELSTSVVKAPVKLLHSGYQDVVIEDRDKPARNLKLAEIEWRSLQHDDPLFYESTANYGRTLFLVDRTQEAVDVLSVLRTAPAKSTVVLSAGRLCIPALLDTQRFDEASEWIDALISHRESGRNIACWRAKLALAGGDLDGARHHVERALAKSCPEPGTDEDADVWGIAFKRSTAHVIGVALELAADRPGRALDHLLEQVRDEPASAVLAQLLDALDRDGREWDTIVREAPAEFRDGSLRAVVKLAPPLGLRWCETFRRVRPDDPRPLVAGCIIASRCNLETALTWSVMAREAGLPELCPLRRRAEQEEQATAERALLWALLADSFGEEEALGGFHATVAEMPEEDVPELTSAMADLTPTLAQALFGAGTSA